MQQPLRLTATLLFTASVLLSTATEPAKAQGPAGAGAAEAAQDNSHSLNPRTWLRKDSRNSTEVVGDRGDAEKKLTPRLHAQGLLAADVTATDMCAPFITLDGCLATLHASHDLALDFICLRADTTGVHTSADVSQCKVADGDKAQGLNKAIHQLKPEANAKQATKEAEQEARDDLKEIGG